ncbi:MAG: S1/P1 nuclease [Endozoicomonas sp.]
MKIALALFLLWPAHALGWFDAGHMASSWITWQELTPTAKEKVQEYLSVLKDAEPETEDFVIASTWLDNIKNSGLKVTLYWHTISRDQAINGLAKRPEKQNGVWIVQEAIETLENPKASRFARAFMLRALIHVVQDLHQPLHICDDNKEGRLEAARCYKNFPIKPFRYGKESLTNLHDFWDAVGSASPTIRYSDRDALKTTELYAKALLERVNKHSLPPLATRDPMIWVRESEQLLSTFAVQGITPNNHLPEQYMARGQVVAEQRLVTAAYRLAGLLNQIFSQP